MRKHGEVVVGNVFDKYGTRNPVARRMVGQFLVAFDRCVAASGAQQALEVGCGEGYLTMRLSRKGIRTQGFDISPSLVSDADRTAASSGLDTRFTVNDIYGFDTREYASELVVCCEVLEHLYEPERAIRRLAKAANPHVLLSVPREPLWRVLNIARLRYLGDFGNTPGHVQHWTRNQFLQLVDRHFELVLLELPLPWTMVLGRVRGR